MMIAAPSVNDGMYWAADCDNADLEKAMYPTAKQAHEIVTIEKERRKASFSHLLSRLAIASPTAGQRGTIIAEMKA